MFGASCFCSLPSLLLWRLLFLLPYGLLGPTPTSCQQQQPRAAWNRRLHLQAYSRSSQQNTALHRRIHTRQVSPFATSLALFPAYSAHCLKPQPGGLPSPPPPSLHPPRTKVAATAAATPHRLQPPPYPEGRLCRGAVKGGPPRSPRVSSACSSSTLCTAPSRPTRLPGALASPLRPPPH